MGTILAALLGCAVHGGGSPATHTVGAPVERAPAACPVDDADAARIAELTVAGGGATWDVCARAPVTGSYFAVGVPFAGVSHPENRTPLATDAAAARREVAERVLSFDDAHPGAFAGGFALGTWIDGERRLALDRSRVHPYGPADRERVLAAATGEGCAGGQEAIYDAGTGETLTLACSSAVPGAH